MKNLKTLSVAGTNALNLIGEKIVPTDILKAEEMLKMNFGIEYSQEKFTMLWEMIREEGWTRERLIQTVKHFLKTKKFPNWTIADWFDYNVKLHPYSWYILQVHEYGPNVNEQMEMFRVNGIVLYRYKDGTDLPFERIQ